MILYFDKKYIMTTGSEDFYNGRDDYWSDIGIAGSHAYSIL